jgi:hypothetical protein
MKSDRLPERVIHLSALPCNTLEDNMLVVIEFGYNKYVFPSTVIPILAGIREVESKSVKGKTKYFVKENEQEIKINLIEESKIVFPNTEDEHLNYKEICSQQEKANNDLYSRIWKEESKVKELEAKVKALTELCPDTHKKEETKIEGTF